MSKPKASVLDDMLAYAEANPTARGAKCWVCSLPSDVLDAVDRVKREGRATPIQILGSLRKMGYSKATPAKLGYHFQSKHHEAKR